MYKIYTWALSVAAAIMAAAILAACSSDATFRIKGKIEGYGTGNLRVVYLDRGAVQSVAAPAIDGSFEMEGRISGPALVRIYTNNGALIGRLIAGKGDEINATFDINDRTQSTVTGNDESARIAEFLKTNARAIKACDAEAVNTALTDYVTANPRKLSAGALLADFFYYNGYQQQALQLIDKLSDHVKSVCSLHGVAEQLSRWQLPTDSLRLERFSIMTQADSISNFNFTGHRHTVLTWTDADSRIADSVVGLISEAGASHNVALIDISADRDTATWHQSLRRSNYLHLPDSTVRAITASNIHRGWMPSAYSIRGLENAAVERLPWFAVADSTGRLLYRGSSATMAAKALTENQTVTLP